MAKTIPFSVWHQAIRIKSRLPLSTSWVIQAINRTTLGPCFDMPPPDDFETARCDIPIDIGWKPSAEFCMFIPDPTIHEYNGI